jgi:hypothetical protein
MLAGLFNEELEEMWCRVAYAFWAKTNREINPFDIKAKILGKED